MKGPTVSRLKAVSTLQLPEGEISRPDEAAVIEGDPVFTTWPCLDGAVHCGLWMATPGEHKVARDDRTLEQFYILEGEIELHEKGHDVPQRYQAGDLVVIEPNFQGIWRTLSTVKKVYFTTAV